MSAPREAPPRQNRAVAVYLSLGSNVSPRENLRSAVAALRAEFGDVLLSPIYRTAAVGFEGADFLNAAARIHTDRDPVALDAWLHALEDAHGRRRDVPRYSDRPLDVDIVLVGDRVLAGPGHLEVPRGELVKHAFVLKPMVDIAPDVVHPTLGITLRALWDAFEGPRDGVVEPDLQF